MGFFSFITQDTNKSIPNTHSGHKIFTVKMIDNQGNEYIEENYDGYGIFGGKSYYELVGEMNTPLEELKNLTSDEKITIGLDICFYGNQDDYIFPMIVSSKYKDGWKKMPQPKIVQVKDTSIAKKQCPVLGANQTLVGFKMLGNTNPKGTKN